MSDCWNKTRLGVSFWRLHTIRASWLIAILNLVHNKPIKTQFRDAFSVFWIHYCFHLFTLRVFMELFVQNPTFPMVFSSFWRALYVTLWFLASMWFLVKSDYHLLNCLHKENVRFPVLHKVTTCHVGLCNSIFVMTFKENFIIHGLFFGFK